MTRSLCVSHGSTPRRQAALLTLTPEQGTLLRVAGALLGLLTGFTSVSTGQTRPAVGTDTGIVLSGRPIPGPVYETAAFTRAVERGSRSRTGRPGNAYWVQHARYTINATLDVQHDRLDGNEI